MKRKNALVACEYSGTVRDALENAGWNAGFMPFSMLFRDEKGNTKKDWRGFHREWANPIIVGSKLKEYNKIINQIKTI